MSSAHVATRGLSSISLSHSFDFVVISSAVSMKRIAELTPPYCRPFLRSITSDYLHIFNFGVWITYFMYSYVAFWYSV